MTLWDQGRQSGQGPYTWGQARNTPDTGRNYDTRRGGTRRQASVLRTGADTGRGVQGGRRMEE